MRPPPCFARFWRALRLSAALLVLAALPAAGPAGAQAPGLPIFDCHLHYSQAAREPFPPALVLAKMKEAGVLRALTSSTPDAGTEALHALAPEKFVPFARPYRGGVRSTNWPADPGTPAYIAAQLAKGIFRGIGEFHLDSAADARTPTVRAVAKLAVQKGLPLHVHAGSAPVEELFAQQPTLKILWAHTGFEYDLAEVTRMLAKYPRLLAETALRSWDIMDRGGRITPGWRKLLLAYPDRFMVAVDTWANHRWEDYTAIIADHRKWVNQLPEPVARAVAYRNAVREFGSGGIKALEE